MKVRKVVTKKLFKHVADTTNSLFKKAVASVFGENMTELELNNAIIDLRSATLMSGFVGQDADADATMDELLIAKEEVDRIYLNNLLQLSTQDLEDIIFLHREAKIRRATKTVEAITSELTRRALFQDSSQSDAIHNNGELHVRKKSRVSRKKATGKKRKASKNRSRRRTN